MCICIYSVCTALHCIASNGFVRRCRRCIALCHLLTVKCSSMLQDELIKMLTFIVHNLCVLCMHVYFQLNFSRHVTSLRASSIGCFDVSTILDFFSSRNRHRGKKRIPIDSKPHFIFTILFNGIFSLIFFP